MSGEKKRERLREERKERRGEEREARKEKKKTRYFAKKQNKINRKEKGIDELSEAKCWQLLNFNDRYMGVHYVWKVS